MVFAVIILFVVALVCFVGKRFLPVYFLKMAHELKKETPRKQIIAEMAQKYGIPAETVKFYLTKVFPKRVAISPEAINDLLWKKRATLLSPSEWRQMAFKREASFSPEQRRDRSWHISTGVKAAAASKPPEERSKIAVKRMEDLSEGQKVAWARKKSASMKRVHAALSSKQRLARISKALAAVAAFTPTQRRDRSLKAAASMTPQERRDRALRREAAMSFKKKRARSLKGAASMSLKQRLDRGRKVSAAKAALPLKEKERIALKAAVSRRKSLFGEALRVEGLPVLNLLSAAERNALYEKHFGMIDEALKRFRARRDFDEIQGIADLAFFVALTKWDKKMDLEKLVRDHITHDLIVYFSGEKRRGRTELSFDE